MSFSCCSRYLECSKEGHCINSIPGLKEECSYNQSLEAGINFYYKKDEKKNSNNTFILIDNRAFYIGKRSSYGTYSRQLDKQQREELRSYLGTQGVVVKDTVDQFDCVDEIASDDNWACCRVKLTIGKTEYNIYNYNVCGVTHQTALVLRNYLRDRDLLSAVEITGKGNIKRFTDTKINTKREMKTDKKVIDIIPNTQKVEQLSLFNII